MANPAKKKSGWLIAGIVTASVAVVAIVAGFIVNAQLEKLPILDNVRVAGVDVGGMTVAEAEAAVMEAIGNDYTQKDMTIQIFDDTVTFPASVAGGNPDVAKAVRAARNYGQVGFPGTLEEEKQIAAASGYDVNLESYMNHDEDAIRQELDAVVSKYSSSLKQSTWTVTGNEPTLEGLAAGEVDLKLVIDLGTPEFTVDTETLYNQIMAAYSTRQFEITGNCSRVDPDPIDLNAVLEKHQILAQDAYLHATTYEIVESHNGCGFSIEEAEKTLAESAYGTQVTIPFVVIEAELTTEVLRERMFRDTLATFTASSTSSASRKTNLRLACEAVDGFIMNPGDVFDYNVVVGERTAARGFKPANAYVGGETVQTIGGGVCQVSSTIYYCALMADMEIVTRRMHSYPSSYIPLGMDATVSWGGPEFRFRNNSPYPIKIVAKANGGSVTVSILSYDDRDYYVKMEYEVLSRTGYSVVYKDFAADNAEGYKNGEVITTPYTGYVVDTYRVKYSKETNQEISRTYEARSTYKHRDKVIARVAAPTPSEPTVPTPPSGGDILDQLG